MTIIDAACQFCHVPLRLEIDDDYAAIGDPYKLLPRACCDRCARLRTRKRTLTEHLSACCTQLLACPARDKAEVVKSLAPGLRALLQAYVGLMEDWRHGEAGEWDEAILQAVIDSPGQCGDVLKRIRDMVKPVRQQSML
jgi:hypothetical protein